MIYDAMMWHKTLRFIPMNVLNGLNACGIPLRLSTKYHCLLTLKIVLGLETWLGTFYSS